MKQPSPRPELYETYWRFAAERQQVYEMRLSGEPGPWTDDPILRSHRFCNVFRASDRVSQYLIRDVIYGDEGADFDDRVLRVILFRLFSLQTTWELIESRVGAVRVRDFDSAQIGLVLDEALEADQRIYTSAFVLCANNAFGHRRKHRNHLALVEAMLRARLPRRLASASSLKEVYEALLEFPLIGPFMAYQIAIDLNYGPDLHFDENEFTMPGPGAARGLKKVFVDLGDFSPQDAVFWLVDQQEGVEAEFGIAAPSLFGRPLHAIDCQNLLCEVDKYARAAFPELMRGPKRIKRRFHGPQPLEPPFYPPHWKLSPPEPLKHEGAGSQVT